jgi:hypothetical protein
MDKVRIKILKVGDGVDRYDHDSNTWPRKPVEDFIEYLKKLDEDKRHVYGTIDPSSIETIRLGVPMDKVVLKVSSFEIEDDWLTGELQIFRLPSEKFVTETLKEQDRLYPAAVVSYSDGKMVDFKLVGVYIINLKEMVEFVRTSG